MIRLKNHRKMPPGEFFIKLSMQGGKITPVSGHCAAPDCYKFGPSPEIKTVANLAVDFARSNNLSGGDFATVLQMIDTYTCQRLGGGKRQHVFLIKRVVAQRQHISKDYASTTPLLAKAGGGCCGAKL